MPSQTRSRRPVALRAATISAGTLTLCLALAGPAVADLGPVPVPAPSIPAPVAGVVQTVTDLTGLPDPLAGAADDPATTTQSPAGHHKAQHRRQATLPRLVRGDTTTARTPALAASSTTSGGPVAPGYGSLPVGLRGPLTRTVADPAAPPVTAATPPAESATLAAATPPRSALDLTALSAGGPRELRVVLLALAGCAVVALAGAHLRTLRELAPI